MFVLTPRFLPTYEAPQCNPFSRCAPASRAAYSHWITRPQPRRPQHSTFSEFFSQVDELLSEIDREAQRQAHLEALAEAQREAHLQRQQQQKRTLRASFAVSQTDQGWQLDGDIQGFAQENINIDVLDDHTLKITGNNQWRTEKPQAETQQFNEQPHEAVSADEAETAHDSDTESHKSYQPTVEDDYEDLGAETSSLSSASSGASAPAEPAESKGKENIINQSTATESAVAQEPLSQLEAGTQAKQQQQPETLERPHGTFERTFRFPQRIDAAHVIANFRDGALRVTIPKAQTPQIRRIAIL